MFYQFIKVKLKNKYKNKIMKELVKKYCEPKPETMRTIKFRVWDGYEMIILENSGLQYYDFEGSYSLGFTVDGYTDFWAHEQYKSMSEKAGKFPIMQFTGLQDKNGKDIYEMDVYNHNGKNFVCIFSHNFGFVFIELNKNLGNILTDRLVMNNHNRRTISEIYSCAKYIEVIGNIYENPELI